MTKKKTNKALQEIHKQKLHYCPECGEKSKLTKYLPQGRMFGCCENKHVYQKKELILK